MDDVGSRQRTCEKCYLQGGEVMGANGDQGALPAQVLVQLVLQVEEARVAGLVQGDAA